MTFSALETITSAKNAKVKAWEKLTDTRGSAKAGEILIEGSRQIETASAGHRLNALIFADNPAGECAYREWRDRVTDGSEREIPVYRLSEQLFRKLSFTDHSQGIIAVMPIPALRECTPEMLTAGRPLVYLDGLADPGNLGTIIRTADALGFAGLILSDHCVSPFNPKVTRSAMGSIFHLPLYGAADFTSFARASGAVATIAADLDGILLPNFDSELDKLLEPTGKRYREAPVLVIGNEAHGISAETLDQVKFRVNIPMFGEAESLNAAIAFGILGYALIRPLISSSQ